MRWRRKMANPSEAATCVFCGRKYAAHAESYPPEVPPPKAGCLLLREHFVAANMDDPITNLVVTQRLNPPQPVEPPLPEEMTDAEMGAFVRELTREALAQQRRRWAEYCDAMVTLIDQGKVAIGSSRSAFVSLAKTIREMKDG